ASDVGHSLRSDPFRVHATGRNFTMVPRSKALGLAVPDQGDLAAQHHDASVEVMGMRFARVAGLQSAMHDLKTFPAKVTLKRFARQGSAGASAPGDEGHSFGPDLLAMHAARRHHEALACSKRFGLVVPGYGDFTA